MSRPLLQRKRTWCAAAVLAAVALAAAFWPEIAGFLRGFDWHRLDQAVRASGAWAPLLCIGLMAFFTVFFLPTTLVGILVGLLYGVWTGLPICLAGLALGMGTSFLIARYLARDWIERRIGDTRLFRRLEEHMRREGWKLVLFTRLLPINPFTFLNYAYGLTRISFGRYLLASTVGVIPNVLALLWTTHAAGRLARGELDWTILVLLFAGAALFAALAWLPRLLRRRLPEAVPAPGDEEEPEAEA